MFTPVRQRERQATAATVDIAPLIDIVFILLIFFLVTTTFLRDTGIEVDKPRAMQSRSLDSESMRISIAPDGGVYTAGRRMELPELRQRVRSFVEGRPNAPVIVIPDKRARSGRLVEVMDAAKAAGAKDIAIATRRGERR